MPDEKNLRVVLKYWRKRRGYSIEKLAKDAKVSTITIQKIEKENRMPRPDVLKRLTETLDVTLEELVIDASEEPPQDRVAIAV
jgi:transcriptional regulator with XRE-family HTH domain